MCFVGGSSSLECAPSDVKEVQYLTGCPDAQAPGGKKTCHLRLAQNACAGLQALAQLG